MYFDRIHDNGATVDLQWTDLNDGDDVVHSMKSKDRPTKDFDDALQAFAPQVRKILGLPKDYDLDIRSVAVKMDPDEPDTVESVIISGVHAIEKSNRPLNLNVPMLELEAFPKLGELIDALHEEAQAYAFQRKRQQLDAMAPEAPHANGTPPGGDGETQDEEQGELVGAEA